MEIKDAKNKKIVDIYSAFLFWDPIIQMAEINELSKGNIKTNSGKFILSF